MKTGGSELSERIKLSKMTENELRELSLQKKKNGCYTSRALAAQRKLWEKSHYPTHDEEYDNGYEVIDALRRQY